MSDHTLIDEARQACAGWQAAAADRSRRLELLAGKFMNTLEKMLLVLGFLVALIGLGIIFGLVLAACSWILGKWHDKGKQAQRDEDMRMLIHYSHWFDDEPTRLLIQDLANGGRDIGKIRDDWRNRREIQSVERGTV